MSKRGSTREDFLEAELTALLGGRECPVCLLAAETERAAVSWLATTNIRNEATIAKLVDSRGLCGGHWRAVLDRSGGDLGVSGPVALSRLAEATAADLRTNASPLASECPVCASVARRERSVLQMLFAALDEPHKLDAYRASSGLCRPHLVMAVELAPHASAREVLIDTHRRALEVLVGHLRDAETDAPARQLAIRRAIAFLAGSYTPDNSGWSVR
jgi:hypothetical protein